MSSLSIVRRLFALAALLTSVALHAQGLRFVPVAYNVDSITGNILNNPQAVAVDAAGNIYITDTNSSYIRKVDPTDTQTVIAGKGAGTYAGDGGPALLAALNHPTSIAVDPAGNIYIGDFFNFAVRKIDTSGIITTYAGGHGNATSGDGGLATAAAMLPSAIATDNNGNVYILDTNSKTVRMVNPAGTISLYAGGGSPASGNGDGGTAIAAKFFNPTGLATDSNGNLFISDTGSYSVRRVDKFGNISTYAGSTVGYSGDGGPATSAQLLSVTGIATDPAGNLYISDSGGDYVRMVTPAGIISTLAGAGIAGTILDGLPADRARLSSPTGIAADAFGNVYIALPPVNGVVQIVTHPERFPQTKVGSSSLMQRLILENNGAASIKLTSFTFNGDFALAAVPGPQSNACQQTTTLVTGFSGYCTFDVVFTPTAEGIRSFPLTIVSNDTPPTLTQTLTSTGLGSALATTSGQMYIVAGKRNGVSGVRGDGGPATAATLGNPNGLAVDSTGNFFFSEYSYCQIRRVDGKTGFLSTIAGATAACSQQQPTGDGGPATAATFQYVGAVAIDSNNKIYISDGSFGIRVIDTGGTIHTYAGTGPGATCGYSGDGGQATSAQFCGISGIAFDKNNNLYIADTQNNVIRMIAPTGIVYTVAGSKAAGAGFSGDGAAATAAQLNGPTGVAVASNGDIYIADYQNQVIRKVTVLTGKISTIAGQHGTSAYLGDGYLASRASLNFPFALAIDAANDLFIADRSNSVIRKIDTNGYITTYAGNYALISGGYNGDALPATETQLSLPSYVAVSSSGYVFILDTQNRVIREVMPNGMLVFPSQAVGTTSASQTVNISNVGNMPMHFDAQFPTGVTGDFALASGGTCNFSATLTVGSSCSVQIAFTPTASGARYGIFAFYDDGVATPQFLSLTGTGAGPQSQTISFTAIPNHIYGDAAFTVSAVASSALPVTYSVKSGNATISGSTVTITGIGTVVIAADQTGNAGFNPATTATQSFTIAKGVLTVTAQNASSAAGAAIVPLSSVTTGFVYNDLASVLSGAPALSTTATTASIIGTYPISIAAGTLAATNYTFNLVAGTYTITAAGQTITFPAIPNHVYGDAAFALGATSSASLPVTYTVTGPATIASGNLTISGIGTVKVTANAAGNSNFAAAPAVSQSFTVAPAVLTVTGQSASIVYATNPAASYTATITGYVNGEGASVVTGTPTSTTTATSLTGVGTYAITPTQNLSAANYTITYVNGVLTITKATATILPNNATRAAGAANPTFTGTVTGIKNNDVVTPTYTTPATITSPAGTYIITASASGSGVGNYQLGVVPATLTITLAGTTTTVIPALVQTNVNTSLVVTATVVPATSGSPTGTVTFYDGVTSLGNATVAAGVPTSITVTAFTGGIHHLTAVYAGDTSYSTSTSPQVNVTVGDYSITGAPITVKQGSAGTTTITLTPTFGYIGSPAPACSNLPLGTTCIFVPATFVSNGSNTPSTVVLTLTTTPPRAITSTTAGLAGSGDGVATKIWLTLSVVGFVVVLLPGRERRKRITRLLMLLMAVAALGISGCGGLSAANPNATPLGTTNIIISLPGSDTAHQLSLPVTVN